MELNLAIATSPGDLPQGKKGNPKVGHFPYGTETPCLTSHTFVIPFSEIGVSPGDDLFIAAHAVVYDQATGKDETAWGGCCDTGTYFRPGKGGGWAKYFQYTWGVTD